MKKLGKFTNTIYDAEYDVCHIHECVRYISDHQANDELFLYGIHEMFLKECATCMRCPESRYFK